MQRKDGEIIRYNELFTTGHYYLLVYKDHTAAQLKTPSEMAASQILGGKTVKNVQFDSQTTEI